MNKERKSVWGWAMYDWANSAFATTVMAGFFPIFFKQYWTIGTDVNQSTAMLGFGNSIASLLVALMAPVLGAIADRGSLKKSGKKPAITVVAKAEFAQSYMAQPQTDLRSFVIFSS